MTIARHRMGTDGRGVSSLVAFWGCPLQCRYCINNFCHDPKTHCEELEPEELVRILMLDEIYYRMSGGGIVFGGGEPLLHSEYIRTVVELLPKDFPIRIETSLNVPWADIEVLYDVVDEWIIDVKDLNPDIYFHYTNSDNEYVTANILNLVRQYRIQGDDPKEHIQFRVPTIPGYNTQADVDESIKKLSAYGKTERFEYQVHNT